MSRRWIGTTRAMPVLALLWGLLSLGLGPVEAQAQAGAVSRADSAAVLFETAERFAERGEPDVAQALLRYVVTNFSGTPAAGRARTMLSALDGVERDGDGSTELRVWAGLYGLYLGLALPAAADASSSEAVGVGLLLGGPGAFLLASAYAGHRDLSIGQARAITWGGTWGTWQGWGWAQALDWGGQEFCPEPDVCFDGEARDTRLWLGSILGGAVGIGTGIALSHRDITPGQATAVNFGSLWGTWFGFAGGYLLDARDDDLLAVSLLGGNAGLVTTALMTRNSGITRSRARLISIAGVMGGLAGLGIDLIADVEDDVAVAIPLATSLLGLGVGAVTTRGLRADPLDPGSEGGAGDAGLALLERAGDGWRTGLPLPRTVRIQSPSGTEVPVHRFELLRIRF